MNEPIRPALLTRSEINWLCGNSPNISKSYEYKMKSIIRKKIESFLNLELPLIQKSEMFSDNLTAFGKDLTVFGKVDNPLNSSNTENCAQNMVGREGFEPSNPAMSRRYLNQARPPAPCTKAAQKFCPTNS
jgi:hypothetical protein